MKRLILSSQHSTSHTDTIAEFLPDLSYYNQLTSDVQIKLKNIVADATTKIHLHHADKVHRSSDAAHIILADNSVHSYLHHHTFEMARVLNLNVKHINTNTAEGEDALYQAMYARFKLVNYSAQQIIDILEQPFIQKQIASSIQKSSKQLENYIRSNVRVLSRYDVESVVYATLNQYEDKYDSVDVVDDDTRRSIYSYLTELRDSIQSLPRHEMYERSIDTVLAFMRTHSRSSDQIEQEWLASLK